MPMSLKTDKLPFNSGMQDLSNPAYFYGAHIYL